MLYRHVWFISICQRLANIRWNKYKRIGYKTVARIYTSRTLFIPHVNVTEISLVHWTQRHTKVSFFLVVFATSAFWTSHTNPTKGSQINPVDASRFTTNLTYYGVFLHRNLHEATSPYWCCAYIFSRPHCITTIDIYISLASHSLAYLFIHLSMEICFLHIFLKFYFFLVYWFTLFLLFRIKYTSLDDTYIFFILQFINSYCLFQYY